MNKYTEQNAKKAQKNAKLLSEIGAYNQVVRDYLSKNPLDRITQYTVKIFKDNAQRNQISTSEYNKLVDDFNNTHGFILTKKGVEYESVNKYYSYINFPYLDSQAFKQTMDNYRFYVNDYNAKAESDNKAIKEYNDVVVINHYSLSETQKKRKRKFESANKSLFVDVYNKLVEKENVKEAIIPKRKIQKIKYQSEIIFHVILGFYVSQLKTRNAFLMEMNRSTSVSKNALPKLKIDHRKLATHKIQNIPRLDICKKTAQNHVKRLREAGILINYLQINQNKPIQVNINPDILEILDGNLPKSQCLENKSFLPLNWKVLHDNSDTTKLNLKEKEIKDCANSTDHLKCGSILDNQNQINNTCPADGYETHQRINKKIKLEGGEKVLLPSFLYENKEAAAIKGKYRILSENFLSNFVEENELAQQLAVGNFDNYAGFRYDYLQKVAQYANISKEDFKAIVIQDFIKSSAKIWKNHVNKPYSGEWKKAINLLKEQLFSTISEKETIIKKLREFRWKLNFARKWFVKSEVKALYPYAYFDKNRTQTNEIGFYGLHKVWKTHLKYKEKRRLEQKELEQKANARKRKLSAQKKLDQAIQKYYIGKFTYKQLFNYVQDNLPNEYLQSLSNIINNRHINLA